MSLMFMSLKSRRSEQVGARLGWARLAAVLAACAVAGWQARETLASQNVGALARTNDNDYDDGDGHYAGSRRIFQSEFALRSQVEATNVELRQLKRDFVERMSDIYIGLRLHPAIGYARARDAKLYAASGNILMAEQFAELLIKRHIIQRRLLTGLKLSLVKMLPMQTLVSLYKRHHSYEWLRYQSQLDVRPKFRQATEAELGALYRLISLRAQVRAAEDVLALTSDNIRRILQVAQWYLVDRRDSDKLSSDNELRSLARHAKELLAYYLDEVVGWHGRLHELYAAQLVEESSRALASKLNGIQGGAGDHDDEEPQKALIGFIDRLINVEALDIGLNQEARNYEFPPTITESMIHHLLKRWIPGYVLESLQADRRLLLANRKRVLHLAKLDQGKEVDLGKWAAEVYTRLCLEMAR